MNLLAKTTLLALAGLTIASQSATAALTYTPGDILLGFRTPTKDYVIDLGNYSNFTTLQQNVTVTNLNADLTTLLGTNWATNTTLSWGAVGYYTNSNASLTFASKGESVLGTAEVGWDQASRTTTIANNTAISTFSLNAYSNLASNTANLTGIISTPDSATAAYWSNFVTGSYTGDNGISFGVFNPTIEANASGGTAITNTALDLFKMSVNSGGGAGAYQGTFTVAGNGDLVFNAVPEPSTYAMLGVGAIAFLGMMRRRSVKA